MALSRLKNFNPQAKIKLKFKRNRAMRLRLRRRLHLRKRQVEEIGAQAEQRLEDDLFKRLERLVRVRRFVFSWLVLVLLLIGAVVAQTQGLRNHYQVLAAVPGGTYTEGVLGTFTNANPLYATDLADTTVSELLFAGLLTYDANNNLTGDLAESWSTDESGTTYTVKLRPNLTWHDGTPLTSEDVVFTYGVIQNPDARSPLHNSWTGIDVTAPDASTVIFDLPNPLASFPHSLTTGIVPKHLLGEVPMTNMRSVSFNSTQPVGAGPFQWQAIELTGGSADEREERIAMKSFNGYYSGKPNLNGFVVRTFRSSDDMVKSFEAQELNGMAGLTQVPDSLKGNSLARINSLPLTAAVMTFFRTQESVLSDTRVRQALVSATDTANIVASLPYPARPVRQSLLTGQVAYSKDYDQVGYDAVRAALLMNESGWMLAEDGLRHKDGKPLAINLYFLNVAEYQLVASQLADYWRVIGADVRLIPQEEVEMRRTISQAPPAGATYDALLYGISIGADPDVFVYWHSSQIDLRSSSRLNFSQYSGGGNVDTALEAGRTRLEPALRAVKYQPFLQAWKNDSPALALYQPRFLYITRGEVDGLTEAPINSDAGRLVNARNWQIRKDWITP